MPEWVPGWVWWPIGVVGWLTAAALVGRGIYLLAERHMPRDEDNDKAAMFCGMVLPLGLAILILWLVYAFVTRPIKPAPETKS